jgi:hypothetical protein
MGSDIRQPASAQDGVFCVVKKASMLVGHVLIVICRHHWSQWGRRLNVKRAQPWGQHPRAEGMAQIESCRYTSDLADRPVLLWTFLNLLYLAVSSRPEKLFSKNDLYTKTASSREAAHPL